MSSTQVSCVGQLHTLAVWKNTMSNIMFSINSTFPSRKTFKVMGCLGASDHDHKFLGFSPTSGSWLSRKSACPSAPTPLIFSFSQIKTVKKKKSLKNNSQLGSFLSVSVWSMKVILTVEYWLLHEPIWILFYLMCWWCLNLFYSHQCLHCMRYFI